MDIDNNNVSTGKIVDIVDIFNEKGALLFQEINCEEWNSSIASYCEGYHYIKINQKTHIYKNGHLIVSPGQYDEVDDFIVNQGAKYGHSGPYIDLGYARVRVSNKWGVINSDGDLIIPTIYDEITGFLRCKILNDKSNCYTKYKYLKAKRAGGYTFFEANKLLKKVDDSEISYIFSYYTDIVFLCDVYHDEELLVRISEDIFSDTIEQQEKELKWFIIINDNHGFNCFTAKDKVTNKIGLLDENEQKLCDFVFDSISTFNDEGIATTKIYGEGEGLISHKGDILLPCKYQMYDGNNISRYHFFPELNKKFIIVCFNGLYGLVDDNGYMVVPCKYPGFESFCTVRQLDLLKCGFILIKDKDNVGLVQLSSSENYYLNCCYTKIDIYYANRYDKSMNNDIRIANFIIIIGANLCKIIDFRNNKTAFEIESNSEKILSIPVVYGNYIIAEVSLNDSKYFCIYSKNNPCCKNKYSQIGYWNRRYIQVSNNKKWGVFDLEAGKEIIPCDYEEENSGNPPYFMLPESNNLICAKKNGKYGFIDLCNNIIVDFKYNAARPFHERIASVEKDGKWEVINEKGESIAVGFEEVRYSSEGLASVKKDGKWGFINTEGKLIIPHRFEEANSFSDGLAAVAIKKNFGYIDKHNQTIIPFRYEYASSFIEGVAEVGTNYGSGTISKDGIIIDWEDYHDEFIPDYSDYNRDSWYAMTDGMYGDYPDEGYDGDYDRFGF